PSAAFYSLSLHDALPIFTPHPDTQGTRGAVDRDGLCGGHGQGSGRRGGRGGGRSGGGGSLPEGYRRLRAGEGGGAAGAPGGGNGDRKSTRLNSSHVKSSY